MISGALLLAATGGLLACTVFVTLVIAAAWRHLKQGATAPVTGLPPVSVLKPLYGLEPNLEANLRSFFIQDYPSYEIIFGTRDLDDPDMVIGLKWHGEYPAIKAKIVTSGKPDRPNAKICSLEKMSPVASTPYLIISDSDVHVDRNYLQNVVGPLLDPKIGL